MGREKFVLRYGLNDRKPRKIYVLMQNTDTRPSIIRYQEKINYIEKYINLYAQKRITRLRFLISVCYYLLLQKMIEMKKKIELH